ncbi:hypothetical protein [Solemya velum gill symbiont]|uniref:Cytochrome P450 n=1 Tax=Solemya velum gill symbiont TaxID=2340 RepID=A0A0B0H817_SOVGS|nr:hypothetical protein [Solemya velum gill symbiont]KHF24009.1 hypothetical protein JV46_02240 [Solemya velum gill symbiont]OOY38665.1 hypothetical protein BOV89_00070 [Solemya velum gill symbiont]OOY40331.1 hypothetical protein BOV90_04450 [Solemya velum gill symbiont]OOY44607.1 hypothetical protein BOV91_00870 [Solemya velum gill symbiont]OOY47231.1 hypothetical protein BOV92_01730 [Solemya velum gill symbiont]
MKPQDNEEIMTIKFPDAKAVIMSKDFHSYNMAEKYREMQSRSGIDFSTAISLIEKLPIFMDGEAHKKNRKNMALLIAATKNEQEEEAKNTIDKLLRQYFTNCCELDLVSDFARPLWHAIAVRISQCEDDAQEVIDSIPSLFSPVLSIRKREIINNRLTEIINRQGEGKILHIALAALGTRPLTGSLALSLYDAILQNITGKASTLDLGYGYKKSSLTYVDRVCTSDTHIGSSQFRSGQRVRCITQSSEYTEEENLSSLYGFGAHVCLGRPISQFIFQHLKEEISGYECSITPVKLEMQENSDPFNYPLCANVRIEI